MLLILTERSDLAADYVVARLIEVGKPYFRLNSEDLIDAEFEVVLSDGRESYQIEIGGKSLSLSDISTVWFRRQLSPQIAESVASDDRAFAGGELLHLIEGAVLSLACRWIDHPHKVLAAERKLYQLHIARSLGIPIPATLISSRSDRLREFAEARENAAIVKPIFRGLAAGDGVWRTAFTRQVVPGEFEVEESETGQVFPTLVQGLVPKGHDLRVTVFGERMHAVRISTSSGAVDWRLPANRPLYETIDVPQDIGAACRSILERLELLCGAFDFAVAPSGEWFFLEVNPVGEWAWLDVNLNLGIREDLIELLFR